MDYGADARFRHGTCVRDSAQDFVGGFVRVAYVFAVFYGALLSLILWTSTSLASQVGIMTPSQERVTYPQARGTMQASWTTETGYPGTLALPLTQVSPVAAVASDRGGTGSGTMRGTSATQPIELRKLSLEESIEIALARNRNVLVQKQEVERMNAQVMQARATAFPFLAGDTRYERSGGTMNFGGSDGITFDIDDAYYGGTLSLIQPVYTAGRTGAALRAAKAARGYARENLQAATRRVVYAVKASFGGVLLAGKMATLARQSLELAEAHLRNVEHLYSQGVASEYELIRARVQVAQLAPEKIRAENEFDRSLIVFRNTLGFSADEKVEPEGELECRSAEVSVEEGFRLARENRHEIAAAQFRVNGMKAALDVARADRYPSLSLEGMATMQAEDPTFDPDEWRAKMWTASVVLSIPVFDGLRTKGKIKQTRAEYEQARLYSEQLLDDVRLEVEQAVSKLTEARELVDSQVAAVEQAEKGLTIANIRYENGVGTQLEVLDAQVALSAARTNYFMSVYQHFMAMAELERATAMTFE